MITGHSKSYKSPSKTGNLNFPEEWELLNLLNPYRSDALTRHFHRTGGLPWSLDSCPTTTSPPAGQSLERVGPPLREVKLTGFNRVAEIV